MNNIYAYWDKILENRLVAHGIFWLAVLFAAPFFQEVGNPELSRFQSFVYRLIGLPLKMVGTYFLVYYQIPKLLQKRKYLQFLLSFFATAFVLSIVYRINNIYLAETLAGSSEPKDSIISILAQWRWTFAVYFWRVYFVGILFLFIKMVKDWSQEKRKLEELQKEKARAELNFLKAQIHPHFLFNTLNNLYALALNKSDKTAEVVAKLSDMLDYMLYQCSEPKVRLVKEIELIHNYVELEQLRYGDRLTLEMDFQVPDSTIEIAPLVLLSIVENAFKHGASGAVVDPRVEIELQAEEETIRFRVFNTKPPVPQENVKNQKDGIGSANIQRQLELVYPGQYDWKVNEESTTYEVLLTIRL